MSENGSKKAIDVLVFFSVKKIGKTVWDTDLLFFIEKIHQF